MTTTDQQDTYKQGTEGDEYFQLVKYYDAKPQNMDWWADDCHANFDQHTYRYNFCTLFKKYCDRSIYIPVPILIY